MAQMGKFRLADASLNYHLQELMENNGWTSGNYEVVDAYPDNLDEIPKFPLISVQSIAADPRPVQIGYRAAKLVTWALDIFAKTDGQRDDIINIIWDDLSESQITIYDFNDGFPSTLGDYTGISTLGTVTFENITMSVIEPDEFTKTVAAKHHALIVVSGYLSVD